MSAGLEVADIVRRHGGAYRRAHEGHLRRIERRVMSAIAACRTAAFGGHVEACDDCGAIRIAYNLPAIATARSVSFYYRHREG
jgi:Transposase zinc-binding domain